MTTILLLVAAVVVYFLVIKKTGKPSALKARRQPATTPSRSVPHHWQDTQKFEFHVVGEAFYQDHLTMVVGDHENAYTKVKKLATLVPENDNPHDDKAVGVFIDGAKVGHLSRDDARSFRNRLRAKGLSGTVTTCDAEVRGGKARNGGASSYDVFLAIKPFSG